MRKLLTGYVVNFNRRHQHQGHLFQNRYKSIVCEEDPYLLELTRYIHLNPVRAGIIRDMKGLSKYPWAGHSGLMGKVERKWQDMDTVLGYFGRRKKAAVGKYEGFVREGISQGRRPELVGGGLIRSLGGWAQVVSLRRKGIKAAHDDRILGSDEFVEGLLSEAGRRERDTLRLRGKVQDLGSLAPWDWEKRGAWRVGVAIWGAAKESIAGTLIVLSRSSGEDGVSGSGSGSLSWGDDFGGGSCGPFGKPS